MVRAESWGLKIKRASIEHAEAMEARVQDSGFRVQGPESRVQGSGLKGQVPVGLSRRR
jgi:hypothetical protein